MILDTNAVSAILAGDKRIQAHLPPGERQHLPVVVIGEYQFGMLGSKRRKKMEAGSVVSGYKSNSFSWLGSEDSGNG
ncbi:MAG: hypothetical protein L0228_00505 [Planctomycetes bacterium]|nr:hypothetical protein [Planctomycetota bacterium]